MKKFLTLVLCIVLLPACSCFWFCAEKKVVGSGNTMLQERVAQQFDQIEIQGQGMLIVKQTDSESLAIEADDNLVTYINSTIDSNTLRITFKENVQLEPRTLIKYYVTVKNLKEVKLMGAAQLMSEQLTADTLSIQATGNSQVAIRLNAKKFNLEATGATMCTVSGTAVEQRLEFAGATTYNAGDLISDNVVIECSGSSRATVCAQKDLKAYISGSAFVGYKGEPMLTIKQSGSASISKVG